MKRHRASGEDAVAGEKNRQHGSKRHCFSAQAPPRAPRIRLHFLLLPTTPAQSRPQKWLLTLEGSSLTPDQRPLLPARPLPGP